MLLFADMGWQWLPLGGHISPKGEPRRYLLSRSGGFTIIELLIVVAIIGILSAVAIPYYNSYRERVKIATCILGIGVIQKTIIAYYYEKGVYPSSLAEVGMDLEKDPWGNPYQYLKIAGATGSSSGSGGSGGGSGSGGSGAQAEAAVRVEVVAQVEAVVRAEATVRAEAAVRVEVVVQVEVVVRAEVVRAEVQAEAAVRVLPVCVVRTVI